MAEAFVRTIKRDDVRVSPIADAQTVMECLPLWFEHYNSLHPRKALRYRLPCEFIASRQSESSRPIFQGQQHVGKSYASASRHANPKDDMALQATFPQRKLGHTAGKIIPNG
jgi:hypothetical protein